MAAHCQVTGAQPGFGHSISHSHRRTKRRWNPNIQRVKALVGDAGVTPKRLNVCTSCLTGSGPCGRQVHCAAAPTRQAAWDLVARDLQQAPFSYDSQTAFIIGNKLFYTGSGNIGASNVWRTYGKGYGIPIVVLDVAKGFVPAFVGTIRGSSPPLLFAGAERAIRPSTTAPRNTNRLRATADMVHLSIGSGTAAARGRGGAPGERGRERAAHDPGHGTGRRRDGPATPSPARRMTERR